MYTIKKPSIIIIIFLLGLTIHAQVGIGTTTPDASAALEVNASNQGLLAPRVALTDVTNGTAPINSPATGLLVYNLNAGVTGGSGIGFYYWSGSQWEKLITATVVDDWKLTGNTGTNPATDYIGTADAQDLVVRTNSAERMRIQSDGDVGIGTNNPVHDLDLTGDFRMQGDFINQQTIRAYSATTQNIPFNNGVFNPLTGTVASITITDGNGVNNSAVFISGFARVFGGNLNGSNSSLGGYFMILQRDDNAAFTSPINVTYTSGICFIETPNGANSASIGFGGSGHISYLDIGLTAGTTYYYRLVLYPNGVGINAGTYDVYQRSVTLLQIKQ
ncbi:MAG: hypothetical protein GYB32_04380 [Algicola sp.]|nr:hypothetical protein [Algicola sp.]